MANLQGIHPAYQSPEGERVIPSISWGFYSFLADRVGTQGDHKRGSSHAFVDIKESGYTVTADLVQIVGHKATRMVVEVIEEPPSITVVQWDKTQAELLSIDPKGIQFAPGHILESVDLMVDLARTLHTASARQPK